MSGKVGRRIRLLFLVLLVPVAILAFAPGFLAPRVIRLRLKEMYAGPIAFDRASIGWSGSEVVGLSFSEQGRDPWLTVGRVGADVSLGKLLRGRDKPTLLTFDDVFIRVHVDREGKPIALPPFIRSTGGGPPPDANITNGTIEIRQEGRPPFVVSGVKGHFGEGSRIKLISEAPAWARLGAEGRLDLDFEGFDLTLTGLAPFEATPERFAALPFVPAEASAHVEPTGRYNWTLSLAVHPKAKTPFSFDATVFPLKAETNLPTAGVAVADLSGRVLIDPKRVRFIGVTGAAIGGTFTAEGELGPLGPEPKLDLKLGLQGIDVERAPASWELAEVAATGRLRGDVRLRAALSSRKVDLSGTTGEAEIENGTIQGFPFKRMSLSLDARGSDFRYRSKAVDKPTSSDALAKPFAVLLATAVQDPKPADPPKIQLPRTISTSVEFDDVDLAEVVARFEAITRVKVPIPISGRASLKAAATIPIAALKNIRDYRFHGRARLANASIGGVDVGRLDATLDLDRGMLTLTDFRGRLVERRDPAAPPPDDVPVDGPLPPGGFRGSLKVGISPPGMFEARLTGYEVPLADMSAPVTAPEDRLHGALTFDANASVAISRMSDVKAWTVGGAFQTDRLRRGSAELTGVSAAAELKAGRLTIGAIRAQLDGRAFSGRFGLSLDAERAFEGRVDFEAWRIEQLVQLLPKSLRLPSMQGLVGAHAGIRGTLRPVSVQSSGDVLIQDLTIGGTTVRVVPIKWRTVGDDVVLDSGPAPLFGGSFTAAGRLPRTPTRPATLKIDLTGLDAARASAAFGSAKSVEGKVSGSAELRLLPENNHLEGSARLTSDGLRHQGVNLGKVAATLTTKAGGVDFEATADGAAGRTTLRGSIPLPSRTPPIPAPIDASLLSVGYSLADLAKLAGLGPAPGEFQAELGLNANLRLESLRDPSLGLHGIVEARGLKWSDRYPIGRLQGVIARDPKSWRLDELRGDFLGGTATGAVWSEPAKDRPDLIRFDVRVDRASLPKVFAFVPDLAKGLTGETTIQINGFQQETTNANAELFVPKATLSQIPFGDLKIPVELAVEADGVTGLLRARPFHAKAAGGTVRGEASMRLGRDHSFNLKLDLGSIDLDTIARTQSAGAKAGAGRVGGRIQLGGPDPAVPVSYRGRIDLDLDEASLVEIPILRELDLFLGASRGGLLEDGDLHATVANGRIQVESLTLEGRLVQMHASGTVGFDGAVALEVAVNTNQIIPQTGQALLELIPGLREAMGENGRASLRMANYLSNRLLKFRISGTVKNPTVTLDPALAVSTSAVGFFTRVLQIPIRSGR